MNHINLATALLSAEQGQEQPLSLTPETGTTDYRPPQMYAIGTAVALLQRDGSGHLRDGTGGWWVWGS